MSMNDPNYRPQRQGTGSSGAWIAGLIILIAIGIGVWFWAGGNSTGPRTAAVPNPPAATTGAGPATTGAAPSTNMPANNPAPANNPPK